MFVVSYLLVDLVAVPQCTVHFECVKKTMGNQSSDALLS